MKKVSGTIWWRGSVIAIAVLLPSPRAQAAPPPFAEVRHRYEISDGRLLDRDGRLLQEQRLSWKGRTLSWVRLDEVSPALLAAVLQAEDRRFREHAGVDWRALAAAAWQNVVRGSKRGASTITMQTASMLESAKIGRAHV